MSFKNIIDEIFSHGSHKHFKYNSLILNVDLNNSHLSFSLFHQGKKVAFGISRKELNNTLISDFKKLIKDYIISANYRKFDMMQRTLSALTDDVVPQSIRDYFISYKTDFPYLVVEDENLPYNIPYGIFFFPDRNITNCISKYGFFLSEYFTIIRSNQAKPNELLINTLGVISSEDLPGSLLEEKNINDLLNKNINIIPVNNISELEKALFKDNPECLHFCCHGNTNNEIIFFKNNHKNVIHRDFFNLHRFPDGAFIFLNICFSNYTNYETEIPRSISDKFLDRNSALVVVTEWPIYDSFAYTIGTNFYKEISNGLSAIEIVHKIKRNAKNLDEKVTALSYSLRGNPNLKISFQE